MKFIIFFLICCLSLNIAEAKNYKKSGFFTINDEDKLKYSKDFKVDDPLNKIILLFNHGQDHTDRKSKHCVHTNMMLSLSKLVRDNKILDKEMLLYSFCTDHFQGDSYRVDWYQKKELIPYKGQTKMDKRVEAIAKLTDDFVELGVPRKQIIIVGNSCGAWATLLTLSQYPDKAGGGIGFMPACYGWFSKEIDDDDNIIEDIDAVFNLKKEWDPGFISLREKQQNIIKSANSLPLLIFTNPDDPFEGKTSYWLQEIPDLEFIKTPANKDGEYFINNKKCFVQPAKKKIAVEKWFDEPGHQIWQTDCFQYYDNTLIKYIEKKIK